MGEKYLCTHCQERIGMIECKKCGINFCKKCIYKTKENNYYCKNCYWDLVEGKKKYENKIIN